MKPSYESAALLKLVETGESEIVSVIDLMPRISLTVDLWPGTKNYKRITLAWNNSTDDYRIDVWGRTLTSRGPRMIKEHGSRK